MEKSQGPPVGIDLGTTHSVIAYVDTDGRPCTVRNAEGDATTPSAVFFDPDGPIVGKEAANAAPYEPDRVAQFAKRDMGESTYEKIICGRRLPPEVIESLILRKLKQDAELVLGQVRDAVITVPAYFNEPRRKATQDAGQLAGLNVLDIINEPTAAAVAYGVQQGFLAPGGRAVGNEKILVYDLGGGTFDVTLMDIVGDDFTTVATAGDVYLGGIDWDQRIVDHVAGLFADQFGLNPLEDESARQHLRVQAEAAKMALTARRAYNLHYEFGGNRLRANLTRETFESLTRDLVERTLFTVRRLLKDASVGWSDLTRVLVVGGSTRMPMITDALQAESGMTPDRSISPDEAVAHGAAVYASVLRAGDKPARGGISITNVNSHDLSVLAVEARTGRPRRKVLIPRNTPLPADGSGQFKTRDEDQRSVVVNVIEGGDASGTNATPIGQCVISDLPPGLPAKTSVDVRFHYKENGRLQVEAWLPEANRQASLTVERAAGLSDDERAEWSERLAAGLRFAAEDEEVLLAEIEPMASTVDVGATGNDMVAQQTEISGIFADDETQPDGIDAPPAGEDPDLDDFLNQL